MANEPVPVATVPTPAPQTPVVAPTMVVQPIVETPVAPIAPQVETPVLEAPVAAQTLIAEGLDKPVAVSPTPVAVVEPVVAPVVAETPKIEDGGQSDEPAPLPIYDPFIAPEGITLDKDRVGKFTELLSDLELKGKADHALVQEFGQKAVDFHIAEVKQAVENVTNLYKQTWERQKNEWKETFLKDPEIGGNRFQTTVDSALTFIRTHGGTTEQQAEFRNLMETSGLGNHPAMIRILASAGKAMSEGRPLAANQPVLPSKSKVSTLYGKGA